MPYKDPQKAKEAKRKYEQKRAKRYTTWTFNVYPESLPEDWIDMLSDLHIKAWVSPLHDRDKWTERDEKINPEHKEGSGKKSHYHVVFQYAHSVTFEEFKKDAAPFNGPIGQTVNHRVRDVIAIVRYLVHKDDPQKAQYKEADCMLFGGADLSALESVSNKGKREALRAMRREIKEKNIMYYDVFYDYCDECHAEWAYLLDECASYTIEKYINSRRHRAYDATLELCNPDTGEPM